MKRWEKSITVSAPIDNVFAYVSDFSRHGEWSGNELQISREDGGPVGVGSTFSTVAKQFGTQREKSTVTDLEAGKLFGWDSTGALGKVHHWFALSQEGGSTEVTKGLELVQPSFLAKMMGWKIARDSPKGLRADLEGDHEGGRQSLDPSSEGSR